MLIFSLGKMKMLHKLKSNDKRNKIVNHLLIFARVENDKTCKVYAPRPIADHLWDPYVIELLIYISKYSKTIDKWESCIMYENIFYIF